MTSLLIVGQAPGRSGDPPKPFDLAGRSGRRLARLCGVSAISDVADVVNLIDSWPGSAGKKGDLFPIAAARRAAAQLELDSYARVLLMGQKVATVFGVHAPFLVWFNLRGIETAIIPHPSGVNRWWNDGSNEERAGSFLREAVRYIAEAETQAPEEGRTCSLS